MVVRYEVLNARHCGSTARFRQKDSVVDAMERNAIVFVERLVFLDDQVGVVDDCSDVRPQADFLALLLRDETASCDAPYLFSCQFKQCKAVKHQVADRIRKETKSFADYLKASCCGRIFGGLGSSDPLEHVASGILDAVRNELPLH